eukprot:scaffold174578_cov23-Prasinocladus_malaysianus.AAC.2
MQITQKRSEWAGVGDPVHGTVRVLILSYASVRHIRSKANFLDKSELTSYESTQIDNVRVSALIYEYSAYGYVSLRWCNT